jgi:hypothetical protein
VVAPSRERVLTLTDFTSQFFIAITAGMAIGIAGLANLLTPRLHRAGRIALTAFAAAVPVGGLGLLLPGTHIVLYAASLVAGILLVASFLGSKWWAGVIGNRTVRWAGLVAFGTAAAVGAGFWYDRALMADSDEKTDEILQSEFVPELVVVSSPAVTDRGHPVIVKQPVDSLSHEWAKEADERKLKASDLLLHVIRLAPADDVCNCHGWVFAGGLYWIGGKEVDPILTENDYHPVKKPGLGDLVIYRDASGTILHSAVVRALPEGLPVLVESKWGCLGVFLHPIDKTPYGPDFTAYRSHRSGHLLVGISMPNGSSKHILP